MSKIDPVPKLYISCENMLIENMDVSNGLASGTRAIDDEIELKQSCQYQSHQYLYLSQ